MIKSGNIYFLIIGLMHPLKFLPLALACLFNLPAFADTAAAKNNAQLNELAARLKTCAKPEWPAESLRREEQGAVTLSYLIGMDGRVIESKVEQSSGYPLLDLAAQDGLAKCLFASPETIGRNEPTWTKMMYVWTLEESETPADQRGRLERDKTLAAAGDPEAIYNMSGYYLTGWFDIEKNTDEALRLLRKSADLGYALAQSGLAMTLFAGKLVDKDDVQAIAWAKKSAAQGSPKDQVLLANILFSAPEELMDAPLVYSMLEQAVAQGNAEAKVMLGILLVEGDDDPGEKRRGVQLIVDAAEAQERMGQHELARIYEQGDLLPKDIAKAVALYERSAAGGFEPAKEALLRLQH